MPGRLLKNRNGSANPALVECRLLS